MDTSGAPWFAIVVAAFVTSLPALIMAFATLRKQNSIASSQEKVEKQVTPSNGITVAHLLENQQKQITGIEKNLESQYQSLNEDMGQMRRDLFGLGIAVSNHITWGDRRRTDTGNDPERRIR